MQLKVIKISQVVTYQSHNRRSNGAVTLNLSAEYSELVHTIELQQLLNLDITIVARVSGKELNLGLFRLKKSTILDDGESKIQFEGLSDFVEVDNLNDLPLKTDDISIFTVNYSAEFEEENDMESDEWDEWED